MSCRTTLHVGSILHGKSLACVTSWGADTFPYFGKYIKHEILHTSQKVHSSLSRSPESALTPISPLWALRRTLCVCESLSHVGLFVTPWTVACQAPLSMEFSRQGYWGGLPCPSPGDLPDPGVEPMSPSLQADSLPTEPPSQDTKSSLLCSNPQSECLFGGPQCPYPSDVGWDHPISSQQASLAFHF